MKKISTIIIILLLMQGLYASAQFDTSKYLVRLPEEWKTKGQFLYKLTNIINIHLPGLNNKQICFDCNAAYLVKLYVSEPSVDYMYYQQGSSLDFTTIFMFTAYMDLVDSNGITKHRLLINEASRPHTITTHFDGNRNGYVPAQQSIQQLKNNALLPITDGQREYKRDIEQRDANISSLQDHFDDIAFIKRHKAALTPSKKQVWDKVYDILLTCKLPGTTAAPVVE